MLWDVLCKYADDGLLNAVIAIYDGSQACMKINKMLNELVQHCIERRQGDARCPLLFQVFMDKCIWNASGDVNSDIFGEMNALILLQADDMFWLI